MCFIKLRYFVLFYLILKLLNSTYKDLIDKVLKFSFKITNYNFIFITKLLNKSK